MPSRHPAGFQLVVTDLGDDPGPRRGAPLRRREAEAAAVCQHVAQRDRFLALGAELGDVLAHVIIEPEESAFPELRDGDAHHRFDRRHPQHERVRAHRHTAAGFTEGDVSNGFAASGHVELRADVQSLSHASLNDAKRSWQSGLRFVHRASVIRPWGLRRQMKPVGFLNRGVRARRLQGSDTCRCAVRRYACKA